MDEYSHIVGCVLCDHRSVVVVSLSPDGFVECNIDGIGTAIAANPVHLEGFGFDHCWIKVDVGIW